MSYVGAHIRKRRDGNTPPPTPVTPTNPLGCVLWLDAAIGVSPNSGTPVGRMGIWVDQSAAVHSCNDSTGAPPGFNFPSHGAVYNLADPHLNNLPSLGGLSADGTKRVSFWNDDSFSQPTVSVIQWGAEFTVHSVCYAVGDLFFGPVMGFNYEPSSSNNFPWMGTSVNNGVLHWSLGIGGSTVTPALRILGPLVVPNEAVVLTWRKTASTVELLVNGISYGSIAATAATALGYVAFDSGYGQGLNGFTGMDIGYDHAQSDADVSEVVTALMTKFGIT